MGKNERRKGKQPVAKTVPVTRGRFRFDLLKGKLAGPGPDFFEPLSESELALWEGGFGSLPGRAERH
jgi:hypothetical protein